MNPSKHPMRHWRQRGASAVEFLFAGGIITILGTVVLQYVLLFNAKNMVGHASFMAARAGSMHHAQLPDIQDAYARALIPLYGGGRTSTELAHALQKARADIAGNTRIELLNPTRESFDDWADAALAIKYEGRRAIRNANQGLRSREVIGANSGQNIQDANLIKVRITHGYELSVPFAGQLMQRLMSWGDDGQDAFKTQMYAQKRIPIITHATVQMQSDAVESDALVAMPGLGNGGNPVDPGLPEVDTPPMPDCISFGCSVVTSGPGDTEESGAGDQVGGTGNDDPGPDYLVDGGGDQDADDDPINDAEYVCEYEPDDKGAPPEDRGFWGSLWDKVAGAVEYGYQFVKGLVAGLRQQAEDIISLITGAADVVRGLVELGKAFYEDPGGTLEAIGEALGQEIKDTFKQATQCSAYDTGKVIGEYISPAAVLKVGSKLAKLTMKVTNPKFKGELTRIFREACASFVAGTPVLTPDGLLAIEGVRAGQQVLSRSEGNWQDAPQDVVQTFTRQASGYRELVTEYETYRLTDEHPVWVQGHGWKNARDIETDEVIAARTGDVLVLENHPIAEPVQVFNFEVANTPSYFVGERGIWVHNASCGVKLGSTLGALKLATKVGARRGHILSNHRHGSTKSNPKLQKKPKNDEFPLSWDDNKIIKEIESVAADPKVPVSIDSRGTPFKEAVRDGVEIRVNFYPEGSPRAGQISTGYPPDLGNSFSGYFGPP